MVTTLEQLNLFEIEEDNDAKKLDAKENISSNDELGKLVVQPEIRETHDVQGSLWNDTKDELVQSNQKTTQFQLLDKVKIVLISEEVDSETYNYRKYYAPHLIGKVGEITNIYVSTRGDVTYEVDVYGSKSIFEEAELIWIG